MAATKHKMIKSKKFQGVYIYPGTDRPGDECYYINYRNRDRKVKNEKVGWKSEGYNQEKAHKVRCERIQSIRHGVELPGKKADIPTYAEAFEFWRQHQSDKGVKNLPNLISQYNKHLLPTISSSRLNELTPKVLTEFTGGWRKKMRDGSIVNLHYIIRSSIQYAIQTVEIPFSGPNPMDMVETPKGKVNRERYLTKDEAQLVLSEMKLYGPAFYMFTAIGLFTGMRLSEILGNKKLNIPGLHGRDINYENGTIKVMGKGRGEGKPRFCEVPKDLMDIIRQLDLSPNQMLFPDKTVTGQKFAKIVTKMGLNKGVKPGDRINSVSAHTLRHTYGSWLAQQGTPIMVIRDLMGHNDIKTTMRYAHLAPRSGREEAGKLTNGITLENQPRV